jgi:LysR family glycine cleavage system transcriptional activator
MNIRHPSTSIARRTPSLTALRAFEAAARRQSFKLAADELAVTPTAISHRIRALEEGLDCRLFVRKTRAVELTDDGRALHEAVREGFDAIAAGVERFRRHVRRSVTISTTPAFAAKWLVPRLASFQATHPHIELHVHASNVPVDLHNRTIDVAIRYGSGRYKGCTATLLIRDSLAPVASPSLRIRQPEDVRDHRLIHFGWRNDLPVDLTWAAWMRAAGQPRIGVKSGVHYSDESHAIQAAVAGQGVALLSVVLVQQELELGLLEAPVKPTLEGLAYYIVRPTDARRSEAVAAVEGWLLDAASKSQASDIEQPRSPVSKRSRIAGGRPASKSRRASRR